jgi:molybdopterin molybdotransferase
MFLRRWKMNENISAKEALELILNKSKATDYEIISYRKALNRIAREDIKAGLFHPPSDNSAMDGYGVKASDCSSVPIALPIIGTVLAGEQWKGTLPAGTVVRIMTGASIPEGVDAIIPFEEADEQGENVMIRTRVKAGTHIRRKGEDYKAGDLLIESGKRISAADIGVLASTGTISLKVSKKPVVTILSTGNELVNPEETPPEGSIRDSNCYGLEAQVESCGAIAEVVGIVRDEKNTLKEHIKKASNSDMLLITGGISKGTADYVKEAMKGLGEQMIFSKVRQRPGGPFSFSMYEGTPVFLLPGNPVSSMICFELYIRPFILKTMKANNINPFMITASIEETISVKKGRTDILRVVLKEEKGRWSALLTGAQGSGILTSMAKANGLLIIPEDVDEIKKGDEWPVQLLC